MRQTIRGWHLQLKSDKSIAGLSVMFDPILREWQQYYGRFYGSALKPVWRSMNLFLRRHWPRTASLPFSRRSRHDAPPLY
jgi:RNA-directed DNA polymerase